MDEELKRLLIDSIRKSVPKGKIGVLFSGGIDSTFIAFVLKELKIPFTCYTANLDDPLLKKPEDLVYSEQVAKDLGFPLKKINLKLVEVEKDIKNIAGIIPFPNVVKVGVALPLYYAMKEMKKDGIKTAFSGLGSEEIFAGYERHRQAKDINKECAKGLAEIHP